MEIRDGKWVFKMIVSNETDKVSVCKCVFLKILNYSEGSIYVGAGGGEVEIVPGEGEFLINSGVAVTTDLKLRYSPGAIKVKITRTELA